MTLIGKLMSLFPLCNFMLVMIAFVSFLLDPSLLTGLSIPAAIYAFPLLAFHLHQWVCPLKEGENSITQGYSPWYGTHMIQSMHITFPVFERILRLVPGVFSLWLRAWGSKIGRNVYWTPHLEVMDRSLLTVGDNCVFGYDIKISGHMVTPSSKYKLMIYVKRNVFGDQCFVGAGCRFAPGTVVEAGVKVPAATDIYPDEVRKAKPPKNQGVTAVSAEAPSTQNAQQALPELESVE